MSGTYGPQWPTLEDVRAARGVAAYAVPARFEQYALAADQTELAYITGVSQAISQRLAVGLTEPEPEIEAG